MAESKKKTIALVSITLNAVEPMTDYLRRHAPAYQTVNYLDGYLMEKVRADGGINSRSMSRMTDMIGKACEDGAAGVIITCTVFTPYQPAFQQLFPIPVICADGAMLDELSRQPGRTAIICTFEGTVETTRSGYLAYRRKNRMPEEVDMYTVSDAFRAAQSGDMDTCDRIVREKILELDGKYDQIALAQISMIGAAEGLELRHARLYISPACALEQLKAAVE